MSTHTEITYSHSCDLCGYTTHDEGELVKLYGPPHHSSLSGYSSTGDSIHVCRACTDLPIALVLERLRVALPPAA